MAVRGRVAAAAVASLATLVAAAGVLALRPQERHTGPVPLAVPTPVTVPSARASPAASWVTVENRRPGTGGWHITGLGARGAIEGWADHVSATAGERVRLYVSTTARRFRVQAYRMGWYGGLGARLVWRSGQLPGRRQPPPTLTPGTNMVATHWHPSLSLTVGADWPPGDYLLKLVAASGQRYVPLSVRDDTSRATLVIQNAVTTWQAYNRWGGRSLYVGPDGSLATRSRVVSFDRPYYAAGAGAGDFLGNEYPLVRLVERLGLDVTYWTDQDLHQHPERLLAHRGLVSLGHDEYWSTRMRRGAEAARAHGVNLAFLGANAVYRHIRLQPSPTGPDREEVNYKPWSSGDDPAWKTDPSEVTTDWRRPPLNDPESRLLGAEYECNPTFAAGVVVRPSSWLFAGTGVRAGTLLPGLVGDEYDRVQPGAPRPPGVQVLLHSPVRCRGPSFADATWYTAGSGAGVFDAGTGSWVCQLDRACAERRRSAATARVVRAVTVNLLRRLAAGPAGADHPVAIRARRRTG
ncbi:MAG TPA: N,N-dimethylformamidase beta subunit family domain-containing protein [Actinomycetota bacterium]